MDTSDTRMHILRLATAASRQNWFWKMRRRVAALKLPPGGEPPSVFRGTCLNLSVNGARLIVEKFSDFDQNTKWWIAKCHPISTGLLEYDWHGKENDWTHRKYRPTVNQGSGSVP